MELIFVLGLLLILFIVVFYALQYVIESQLNAEERDEVPEKCACNHECQAADCPCPTIPCGPDCKCRREDVFGF